MTGQFGIDVRSPAGSLRHVGLRAGLSTLPNGQVMGRANPTYQQHPSEFEDRAVLGGEHAVGADLCQPLEHGRIHMRQHDAARTQVLEVRF